jgi:hypothetical protein
MGCRLLYRLKIQKKRRYVMKVPELFKGMKKVKEYSNHVLYEDKNGIRECFQYWDLGFTTKQIKSRLVNGRYKW